MKVQILQSRVLTIDIEIESVFFGSEISTHLFFFSDPFVYYRRPEQVHAPVGKQSGVRTGTCADSPYRLITAAAEPAWHCSTNWLDRYHTLGCFLTEETTARISVRCFRSISILSQQRRKELVLLRPFRLF